MKIDDNHVLSNNSFDDIDIEIDDLLEPDDENQDALGNLGGAPN